MPKGKLKSFNFYHVNKRGVRIKHTFYAATQRQATEYARAWGEKMGVKMYRPKAQRGS